MARLERRLALALGVAGVLLLFVGASLALVEGGLVRQALLTLIGGLALLIATLVIDPGAAADLARSRRARYGSLSVLVSAAVIGILVGVNVVVSRSTQAADFTKGKLYTLSPESVLVTRRLDSDLLVTGFFRPDERATRRDVEALLNLYRQQSPHVKVRFVDPDQDPAEEVRLGVTIAGSLVLQYRDRSPVVLTLASEAESDVTGAILRLETSRAPVVCWAAGDGERDLLSTDQSIGYSATAGLLKTSNYQVQTVLLSQQAVPSSCDVLAIVGVLRPLSDATVAAVGDYLAAGGKLLLAMDPWVTQDGGVLASVNRIVKPYGPSFDGGLVVEGDPAHSAAGDSTTPVVFEYGASPITKDLAGRYVFFPQPTSVDGESTGDATSSNLVTTSERSYQVAQPRESLGRLAADKAGPFVLMQALEERRTGGRTTRIVLVGTSALAENLAMPPNAAGSNPDLLLASLDWLSQQESLIAVGPKAASGAPLALTDLDLRLNQVLTLLVLPLLVVAAGLTVSLRRRRALA